MKLMSHKKINKKGPYSDYRQTLNSLHEEKLKEFAEERATLPDKEDLLGRLIVQYKSKNPNDNRYELYDKINNLQIEVKRLRDNYYEAEYLSKAAPFLNEYAMECEKERLNSSKEKQEEEEEVESSKEEDSLKNNNGISRFVKEEITGKKGDIYEKYINEISGIGNVLSQTENFRKSLERLNCQCGGKRLINEKEATASCTECGSMINYQDRGIKPEYSEEVQIVAPFSFDKRGMKSMTPKISRHYFWETVKISGIQINLFVLISC